jgi:glycosyltransferase involved in cell wall biosynthesis
MSKRLLLIDPHLSWSSPSMRGVVRSLGKLKEAGWEVEAWCWRVDPGLDLGEVCLLPRFGDLPLLYGQAFAWQVRRRWRKMTRGGGWVGGRPDLIFTVGWYAPFADLCAVQFSQWDWERRQAQLGVGGWRDWAKRAVNIWYRGKGERFLRDFTGQLLVPVSRAVAEDLRPMARGKEIVVFPNAYDRERFHGGVRGLYRSEVRGELGIAEEDKIFVFVSTGHHRRKGFPLAVAAIEELWRRRGGGVWLLVVGGGEATLEGLRAGLAREHPGWESWLRFTGARAEVERYLGAADGFLFPSWSEAFALVEVEAAACGLPLFLTPHHGTEMVLKDGENGRLVPFDAVGIADVLEEYVEGRWEMGELDVGEALEVGEYGERLAEILDHALAKRLGRGGEGGGE